MYLYEGDSVLQLPLSVFFNVKLHKSSWRRNLISQETEHAPSNFESGHGLLYNTAVYAAFLAKN